MSSYKAIDLKRELLGGVSNRYQDAIIQDTEKLRDDRTALCLAVHDKFFRTTRKVPL